MCIWSRPIFSHSCPASIITARRVAFGQVHAVGILLRHSAILFVCDSGPASSPICITRVCGNVVMLGLDIALELVPAASCSAMICLGPTTRPMKASPGATGWTRVPTQQGQPVGRARVVAVVLKVAGPHADSRHSEGEGEEGEGGEKGGGRRRLTPALEAT